MPYVFLIGPEVQPEHSEAFLQAIGVALPINCGGDPCEAVKIKLQILTFFPNDGGDSGRASVPYKGARGALSPSPFYGGG